VLRSLRAKNGYQVEIEALALVFRVPHSRAFRSPGGLWEYPPDDLKALAARLLGLPEREVEFDAGIRDFLARPCPGRTSGQVPQAVIRKAVWQHMSGPAVVENGATWEVPGLNGAAVQAIALGKARAVRLRVALCRPAAEAMEAMAAQADIGNGQALIVCQPSAAWCLLIVYEWMGGEVLADAARQGRLAVLVVRARAVRAAGAPPEATPAGHEQAVPPGQP
jgi:hypothetical protein